MVFWLGILSGGIFVWFAIKIGFYEIWVMLFNIVISIYVAIFLTPLVLDIVPGADDIPCCNAFALAVLGGGTFLILYGITYVFLTGQFKVAFPKLFEILFTGILGFLAGFLVLSFAAFVITITPISQNRFVKQIGFTRESQQTNISYMCVWCDLVNSIVSSDTKITSKEAIEHLLSSAEPKTKVKTGKQTSVDEPIESKERNEGEQPDLP
ncbi:MAG: CvpA family protein [Sedimentisphaerales bacterium]|nr:CvpA family protein [Sedimentisphaerales bacterium]